MICEYLDETALPRLHPANALQRARHRSWMEFGATVLGQIAAFYNAADEPALLVQAAELRARLCRLEAALGAGPDFAGPAFSMVDAVFGPVFRYVDAFEDIDDSGFAENLPRLAAWRLALAVRPSVRAAVSLAYPASLREFLAARPSALAARMARTDSR